MTDVPRVELAPGYSISQVINGCWQLTPDHGGGQESRSDRLRQFSELVEAGFTTFDCADIYEGTEALLGDFRRTLANPELIQLHTKFVPNRASLAELSDRDIDATITRSLLRLGVEQLDLVQFHWWDYAVPGLERMFERLLHAQSLGRIRLLGVTNFNTALLRSMVDTSASIVSMQTQYSLLDRRPEREMTNYCAAQSIALLPYGVLAGGFLSEKYLGTRQVAASNRSLQKYQLIIDEAGGWDALQQLLGVLSVVARKHGDRIATIAARWVLDQPAVGAIILGMGSRSRAAENARLNQCVLDREDRESIARTLAGLRTPEGDAYDIERDPGSVHSRIIRTELQESGEPQ